MLFLEATSAGSILLLNLEGKTKMQRCSTSRQTVRLVNSRSCAWMRGERRGGGRGLQHTATHHAFQSWHTGGRVGVGGGGAHICLTDHKTCDSCKQSALRTKAKSTHDMHWAEQDGGGREKKNHWVKTLWEAYTVMTAIDYWKSPWRPAVILWLLKYHIWPCRPYKGPWQFKRKQA